MKDKFTGVQWFISIVTIVTIVLWCVTHQLENVFGDMGVVAIIPIVLFFGTGILTKEDFNNFLWTIIILAAGGLSLGKAVSSSGLLHTIASTITEKVEGMSLYGVLVVFAALILVVATFISHTVAALIILPLVHTVGAGMKEPHPNLLVMGSALMASGAMGLPTSGFPNMSKRLSFWSSRISVTDKSFSRYHDGRFADRPAVFAGQTFHFERDTSQYHYFSSYYNFGLWAFACHGALIVERCLSIMRGNDGHWDLSTTVGSMQTSPRVASILGGIGRRIIYTNEMSGYQAAT